MNREKVLEVNDLTVSFKTPNGLVRAVRGVSFDLYKGETLAIVGESGSGKSVTTRAIMGILAGNGIIDNGEILYRNQDLTKLSEENFHKIRGNKIGMIFQDPLSSLNPIMKIGKQITEAMLVNGNHLKTRYHDIFHLEYHDYLNKITLIKLIHSRIKHHTTEIMLDDSLSKAEKKAKIKEYTVEQHALIKEYKKELPALKARYLAKKKEAKAEVKAARKAINTEKAQEKGRINAAVKELMVRLREDKALLKQATTDDEKAEIREQIQKDKKIIAETKEEYIRKLRVTKAEAKEKAISIMKEVGIDQPEKRFNQYPFQFSGGMRQRIVIAIALTANPEILICDEPTTALDVTIQGQILNLIKQIKEERDLSVIFITHDLGVVANMASRVGVMYAGKIVEYGNSEDIFYHPKHPYTWALLSSVPDLDTTDKLLSIPGTPPDMLFPPKGDAFAARNKHALKIDFLEEPPFFKISDSHYAATWLLHPDAPKIEMPKIINERVNRYKQQVGIDKKKFANNGQAHKNVGDQVE